MTNESPGASIGPGTGVSRRSSVSTLPGTSRSSTSFGTFRRPFFIDHNGGVVFVHIGQLSATQMAAFVREALASAEPGATRAGPWEAPG